MVTQALNSVNAQAYQCPDICPAIYSPVCAVDRSHGRPRYRMFSNSCALGVFNCQNRASTYSILFKQLTYKF